MGWPKGKSRKVSLVDEVMSEPEPMLAQAIDVQTIPERVPDHCGICRFWDKQAEHGLCRRFPAHPRPNDPAARWPVMPATDWCGEFKAK